MANIRDMLRRTLSKLGEDVETSDILDWYNDCLDEVSDVLFMPTTATITRSLEGIFVLPANYNTSLKLYIEDGGEQVYPMASGVTGIGYVFENGTVRLVSLPEQTSLFIVYNRNPIPIVNNPEMIPDIPPKFHRIFEHYACAIAMLADEEHERYAMYNQQYLKVRSQLQVHMSKQRALYFPMGVWEVVR